MNLIRQLGYPLLLLVVSVVATWSLIGLLKPLLLRYALARPNARSSHVTPTPQGGGIAVVAVVAVEALLLQHVAPSAADGARIGTMLGAVVTLAVLGAWDDIRPLPVLARLVMQVACAVALVAAVPAGSRVLPVLPAPVEAALLVIGLVWFINLTNFMDGIDWITVVEFVPMAIALYLLASRGDLPADLGWIALALAGALIGFAPYNKHVARLFLGDVGSLAIGGLVGWLLVVLAAGGQFVAAAILPMYYLADSGLTLWRRWRRRERLWEAHRTHVYQLASQRGFTVPAIIRRILWLNVALGALGFFAASARYALLSLAALAVAAALTAATMRGLERGNLT